MSGRTDPARPVSVWKEEEAIDGTRAKAMVIIFRTRGCKWSREQGCLMCGYNTESCQEVSTEDLRSQLNSAAQRYDGERMVKIYTSGSFLDPNEILPELRKETFSIFSNAERILVESRPEFVTPEQLGSLDHRAEIAIGLETASDLIREKCVRKGFSYFDYLRAAEELQKESIPLRTYLLLKPPFLTEREGVEEALRSIELSSPYSESISINPVNVQRDTVVERLWKKGDYRPPWFWSLVEVLRRSKDLTDKRVFSAPSGAGSVRGVHNCDDQCDERFIEAVDRFSFSQDPNEFSGLECGCRKVWAALMDTEEDMSTSVDVPRYLSSELEFD